MSSKAQVEIIGLLLIIILVSMGILFALYFAVNPAKDTYVQAAKESILAANWLNTMLGTTTGCLDRTTKELLQDCALGTTIKCPGDKNSCQYANETIGTMLDRTLNAWQRSYNFYMNGSSYIEGITFGKPCKGEREAKTHILPAASGFNIKITLQLCR